MRRSQIVAAAVLLLVALSPGAAVVYDEPLKLNELRTDLIFYPVPFDKLIAPVTHNAKLRRLVRNAQAHFAHIDLRQLEAFESHARTPPCGLGPARLNVRR